MVALAYIRDKILLNDAFLEALKKEIETKKIAANSTLLIAARKITHAPSYTLQLDKYHLIIAADEYDGAGGAIDVSGLPGAVGAQGAQGAKGYAGASHANDKPGGNGGNGGQGAPGAAGMYLTVFCKTIKNAKLIARGGAGGNGGNGGNGGPGGSGIAVIVDPEGGKIKEQIGTSGGNGGNGGKGNVGGKGGKVTVIYLDAPSAPTCSVTGGAAGAGGPAGIGGKGGAVEPNGKSGVKGAAGTKGADGATSVQKVDEAAFWSALRRAIGAQARTWAEYRTRVGDYFCRSSPGKGAKSTLLLQQAAHEFRSAGFLDTTLAQAKVLLDSITQNINPLGIPRDQYLIPGFRRYERAFTEYAPLVQAPWPTPRTC